VTGQWFSLGPPVSSTNKTDHHDITEILLKVALNTIAPLYNINRRPILPFRKSGTDVLRYRLNCG
jgi:hypothetical protein